MSLKTFLAGLVHTIGHFFKNLAPQVKHAVKTASDIVEAIKTFDSKNPIAADLLTSIIPGNLDDEMKAKARAALPKIATDLRLVGDVTGSETSEELMTSAKALIDGMSGDIKSATLHSYATLLSTILADGKIDWADAVYISQFIHDHQKV